MPLAAQIALVMCMLLFCVGIAMMVLGALMLQRAEERRRAEYAAEMAQYLIDLEAWHAARLRAAQQGQPTG